MIDLRKIDDSGIGTYLRNVVPRVAARCDAIQFLLLGNTNRIEPHFHGLSNCIVVECDVRPLSSREQLQLTKFIPDNLDFYWATHFNIPLFYRGRLLVTVHDIMPMARPDLSGGRHHYWYVRLMMAAIKARRSKILAVSEFTKLELQRLAGIPAERINVTPLAVDDIWRKVQPREPAPLLNSYLLFVGIVKPHKNLITLLKAFEQVAAQVPYTLVVVGEREALATKDDISAAYAEQLGERVVFTGRVSDNALEQWMAHATAYVAPSLYEGFGLPSLEAMACGTPVICSNAASLPEVCGYAALYFDPTQPEQLSQLIVRLSQEPELIQSMRKQSLKRAGEFDWSRTAELTAETLLRELQETKR